MITEKKAITAKNEILDNFPFWRREGVDAFLSIAGFADVLLSNKPGELNEQQRSFITSMRIAASRGARGLMSNGDYLKFRYRFDEKSWKWQKVSIEEVCEKIVSSRNILSLTSLKFEFPIDLPAVKADFQYLLLTITYLIEPSTMPAYWYKPVFQAKVTAQSNDTEVIIQIESPIVFPENGSTDLTDPGSSLAVANLLVEKHGSTLKLAQVSQNEADLFNTIFEFTLPIWKED